MNQRIIIEKWAENLEEVTIGRWLKQVGESVEAGEVLCEIITDKITFEYTPENSGTVLHIYAAEQSVVPVGYVIACTGDEGELPDPAIISENERLLAEHVQKTNRGLDLELEAILGSALAKKTGVRATPAARRIARQNSVSIEEIAAWLSENAEMVRDEDVEAYLQAHEEA